MNYRTLSIRRPLSRRTVFILTAAAAALPGFISRNVLADRYWKNSVTNGSWSNANNWSASSVAGTDNAGAPGSSDNVYLENTTSSSFTITLDTSDTIEALEISNTGGGSETLSQTSAVSLAVDGNESVGYNGAGIFNQSAGTHTIGTTSAAEQFFIGNSAGATGTYNLSGTSTLTVNGSEYIGYSGAGTFIQSAGVHTIGTASVQQALDIGFQTGSTGTYTLNGAGTLTVNGNESVGYGGNGTFNQSAGTNSISYYLNVGDFGMGSYTLSGTASLSAAMGEYVGYFSGTGTFNQSGGTNTVGTIASPQNLYIGVKSGIGTYLLSGGQLTAGTISLNGAQAQFNWTGGTLSIMSSTLVVGSTGVLGNALSVGTGQTLSVTQGITVNSGGTLTVAGSGALTAAGGIINNGSTIVSGGAITPTTFDGTGTLTVNNAATLTATHIRQNLLNINSGSTVTIADSTAPGTTAATSILTDLTNSGTLNLQNNDLIVTDSTQFTAIQSAITSAYHGGAWNQAGITSTSAAAKPNAYGLGYATAGAIGTTSFDGQTGLASGTVLVKYTLLGDSHLSGTVGLTDYNVVLANLNTGTLWTQGAFHPGSNTGLADYNAVVANFNRSASGNLAAAQTPNTSPAIKAASLSTNAAVVAAVATSNAATDMKLEVNTVTGDVFALATTATALTGYDIFDSSNHLLDSGDPNTDLNELLLSQPTTNRGNTTTFRNTTNYKLWTTILDNASTLAEGENNGKLKQGTASTYDTINVPSGGTIDFGHVYAAATNKQDLTFSFSEADPTNAGNPVTGTTYGGEVDYVSTNTIPEPGMLGLLGLSSTMMMRRRGRSAKARFQQSAGPN